MTPDNKNDKPAPSEAPSATLLRAQTLYFYKKRDDANTVQPQKHMQYMYDLEKSGKSIEEIESEWYQYYADLDDQEKKEVWNEFYESQNLAQKTISTSGLTELINKQYTGTSINSQKHKHYVSNKKNHRARHGIKSIAFGLSIGALTTFIFLFSFFNERFITPFITPSSSASSSSIISSTSNKVGSEKELIIPKINVQLPIVYDIPYDYNPKNYEKSIQSGLERGVVHYDTTPKPGQNGNLAIIGHSSNNILNKGRYKFAFVLLNRLDNGDLFYITENGIRYTYKVFSKKVVSASDVSVLQPTRKVASATLITCDPPGTSINRLVVVAEQIDPDPSLNQASNEEPVKQPEVLPGNAPSLWQRIKNIF